MYDFVSVEEQTENLIVLSSEFSFLVDDVANTLGLKWLDDFGVFSNYDPQSAFCMDYEDDVFNLAGENAVFTGELLMAVRAFSVVIDELIELGDLAAKDSREEECLLGAREALFELEKELSSL